MIGPSDLLLVVPHIYAVPFQFYGWHIIMIGPSDLLLVVPHIYAVSPFSLMGGLQKCQYGSEKIVLQGHHILSTAGDALRG
jgi:hypothetical protein